jgi:ATP-binding cassette subfamily B protein
MLEWFYARTFGACIIAVVVPLLTLGGLTFLHLLLSVILLPPASRYAGTVLIGRNANQDNTEIQQVLVDVNAEAIGGIQGLKEILSFGYRSAYTRKPQKYNRVLTKAQTRNGRRIGLENDLLNLFMSLGLLRNCAEITWLFGHVISLLHKQLE